MKHKALIFRSYLIPELAAQLHVHQYLLECESGYHSVCWKKLQKEGEKLNCPLKCIFESISKSKEIATDTIRELSN